MAQTDKEFRFYCQKFPEWEFQEHETLSTNVKNGFTRLRKDIRDAGRQRVISVSATVLPSATSDDDIKTAIKMIESIKVVPK
jgi:hypothetical protein